MSKIYDYINEIDGEKRDGAAEELKKIDIAMDQKMNKTIDKKIKYSLLIFVLLISLISGYFLAGLYLDKSKDKDVKNTQLTNKNNNNNYVSLSKIPEIELVIIGENKRDLEKTLTKLQNTDNKDNISNNNIALILCELKNYKEALEYAEKLIIQEPNNPYYWNTFGIVLTYLNLFDDAEKSFKKAISLKGDEGIFYYNLGNLYEREGKLDLAKEYYLNYLSKGDKYNIQNLKAIKQKISRGL